MTVSWTKYWKDDLAGFSIVKKQFIEHKLTIITIEHGHLLITVCRVICCIHINNNTLAP